MEEELKEVWTTLVLPVTRFSNNDYYRRKDKGQIKAYNNLSEYKPTYLPVGAIGYDGSNKTYRLLKPIKVKNSDGGFDYYMVPEFAVEGVYIDKPKPVVEPIADLAPLNNQLAIILPLKVSNQVPPKSNTVVKLPAQKPVTPKSNTVVKLPVPLNLLPYIANVTSDGVVFFNVPDGYTLLEFDRAMKAVFLLNKDLEQKPMVYYEQPKQLILKLKLKLKAVLLSLELYLKHRLLILKYITSNNVQTVKVPVKKIGNPDLVTEVFVYPEKTVRAYNMHPEEYLKILEYLNKNYLKTKTNNKPDGFVLSLSGFDKVPIGGEVNDTLFYYINKDGKRKEVDKWYYNNPNIINENDPVSIKYIEKIDTNNGKSKMYSYSNGNEVYYKHNGYLVEHPFIWRISSDKPDASIESLNDTIPILRKEGFTELLIMDFVNKKKSLINKSQNYNVDKSIFYPIEEKLQTPNNSELLINNIDNSKLLTKGSELIAKKVVKILNFLGFLNGGQLKYYNNGKQIRIN